MRGQRPRRHYQPWTSEDEQRLCRLMRQGYSWLQVAQALGRTEWSVKTRAYEIRLLKRPIKRVVLVPPDERGRNRYFNTLDGFSPVAIRGLLELEAGLEWIARHLQHGYVVHDGMVRTIGQAVGNLIYDLHIDARKAQFGEVA